jgi:hypothetical protein
VGGRVALIVEQNDLFSDPRATIDEDGSRKVECHLLRFVGFDGGYVKNEGIRVCSDETEHFGISVTDVQTVVLDKANGLDGWDLNFIAFYRSEDHEWKALWVDNEFELIEIWKADETLRHKKLVVRLIRNKFLLTRDRGFNEHDKS